MWSLDDWKYVTRTQVTDAKGRTWTVALMDILGQDGDPDMPNQFLELQYASGRFFTLIYSATGVVQWERAHKTLDDATAMFDDLLGALRDGSLDPAQPTFRANLED
jgi:hypothetical protein